MKTFTVKQPWASLIVHGIKDTENRTWACPKRYIGKRVLIHASGSHGNGFKVELTDDQMNAAFGHCFQMAQIGGYDFGAIIGSVQIVDCVQNHPSIWAEKGVYNWVLANPVLFEKPMPAKGKLSFWESGLSEEELIEHFKTK